MMKCRVFEGVMLLFLKTMILKIIKSNSAVNANQFQSHCPVTGCEEVDTGTIPESMITIGI